MRLIVFILEELYMAEIIFWWISNKSCPVQWWISLHGPLLLFRSLFNFQGPYFQCLGKIHSKNVNSVYIHTAMRKLARKAHCRALKNSNSKLWNCWHCEILVEIVKFWLKLWNLGEIVKFGWNCEIWAKLWKLGKIVKFGGKELNKEQICEFWSKL